jgi:hypothetical protein
VSEWLNSIRLFVEVKGRNRTTHSRNIP